MERRGRLQTTIEDCAVGFCNKALVCDSPFLAIRVQVVGLWINLADGNPGPHGQ